MAAFNGLYQVGGMLIRGFAEMIGINLGGSMGGLKSAMQQLTSTTLIAAAGLLKLIAPAMGGAFIQGVTASLSPAVREDSTGFAAARDAQMGDQMSYARRVTTAALLAGPGGPEADPDVTWKNNLLKQLEQINSGENNPVKEFWKEAKEAFKKWFEDLPPALAAALVTGTVTNVAAGLTAAPRSLAAGASGLAAEAGARVQRGWNRLFGG